MSRDVRGFEPPLPDGSRFYGPLQLAVSASHAHHGGESVDLNPRHPKVLSLSGRVP